MTRQRWKPNETMEEKTVAQRVVSMQNHRRFLCLKTLRVSSELILNSLITFN